MFNCKFHETVMTVIPASRYTPSHDHDLIHVESTFTTDAPIQDSDNIFFVPGTQPIPTDILNMINKGGFTFEPIPKSEVIKQVADYAQEISQNQQAAAVSDAVMGIATQQYMQQISMKAEPTGSTFYHLSYDFILLPENDGTFELKAKLPYKGFDMPAGGQVRLIVVLPVGATCDTNATKGTLLNGQQIQEATPANVANGVQVVSFFYQNDPDFLVKYKY